MLTCRICLHTFARLKFQTEHIGICTRCVNTLNGSPEPAKNAEARLAAKLARGMQRNAERDLLANEDWKREKARRILADVDAAVAAALHDWITRLLAKPENSTKDFKIMRAHRRGLLRMDGFAEYPSDWADSARRMRRRDGNKCVACGTEAARLDVHHIVYLSRFGTNQQSNLVTLCRPCHEKEHDRAFDFGEESDPESTSPIRPPPGAARPAGFQTPPLAPAPMPVASPPPPLQPQPAQEQSLAQIDLTCPGCNAKLTAALKTGRLAEHRVRCPVCERVFSASEGLESRLMPATNGAANRPRPPTAPRPATDEPAQQPPPPPSQKSSTFWPEDIAFFGVVAVLVLLVLALAT